MSTLSLYVLSTKYNSYIGYYSGSVSDLIKYEWEEMEVNVQLFYTHSNAKELVSLLKKYFDSKLKTRPAVEKDIYGFWTKKLTTDELDKIFEFITPKLKYVEEQKPIHNLAEYPNNKVQEDNPSKKIHLEVYRFFI